MKNFVDLKNYLIKEIKPQENYQYFIFKELINSGGQISYDELANRYDAEYENTNKTDTKTILKDAPTVHYQDMDTLPLIKIMFMLISTKSHSTTKKQFYGFLKRV